MITRRYKHLGRRVCNRWTGICGIIVGASERGKRGWDVTIDWDDGHRSGVNWESEISDRPHSRCNHLLVADDYAPDYGPVPDRIRALIARIDSGPFPFRLGHSTELKVGRDSISYWAPFGEWEATASLYGGQGRWSHSSKTTLNDALAGLRAQLVAALEGGAK